MGSVFHCRHHVGFTRMTLIQRATTHADFERPLNEPRAPEVPQGLLEYNECLRAMREQLLARVQAAGRQ